MHGKRAAQTPLLEKLDVKTCSVGLSGAINTLWREMLQAPIRRQNEPFGPPFSRDVKWIRLFSHAHDNWGCDRVFLRTPMGEREFPVSQFIGDPNNSIVKAFPIEN